jgi:hypothetical protein
MTHISGNGELYDHEEIFNSKVSNDYEEEVYDDDYLFSTLDETILIWEMRHRRF